MKIDLLGLEQRHKRWKQEASSEGIQGITKANSDIIIQHVLDMEIGQNVARGSKKGGRSYARLYNIRQRLTQLVKMFEERGVKDIRKVTDKEVTELFSDMDRGEIKTAKGEKYRSSGDYAKVFKAFWHWYQKINRKEGRAVVDVCEDISTESEKPLFVWLKKEELEKIIPFFNEDEQLALMFMFDSGIRTPTECLSLLVEDIFLKEGDVWVNVRDDVSKTFGRQYNLLFCGQQLLDYIKRKELKSRDRLFDFSPPYFNRKLKKIAEQVFGDKKPHPTCDYYKNLNLYDLRHSSAIHFRLLSKENPADISLDAVRHRFGWTDFTMLNYYSQFLGMDGKIDKVGMLLKQDKHKLERDLEQMKRKVKLLENFKKEIEELKATMLKS